MIDKLIDAIATPESEHIMSIHINMTACDWELKPFMAMVHCEQQLLDKVPGCPYFTRRSGKDYPWEKYKLYRDVKFYCLTAEGPIGRQFQPPREDEEKNMPHG